MWDDKDKVIGFKRSPWIHFPASTPRWVPDGPNVVFHVGPIWVFPAWPHIGVANGHRMGPIWGNNGYPCGAQIEPTKYPDEAHIETTWYLGAAHMVPAAAHTGPRFNPKWYPDLAHIFPGFGKHILKYCFVCTIVLCQASYSLLSRSQTPVHFTVPKVYLYSFHQTKLGSTKLMWTTIISIWIMSQTKPLKNWTKKILRTGLFEASSWW